MVPSICSPTAHPDASCASPRRNDSWKLSSRFEDEECAGGNQRETEALAESDRLLQIKIREPGEHHERDHLMHRFQLCWVIDRAAVAILRVREAIFNEDRAATDKDHINDRIII